MKKILSLLCAVIITTTINAQGKSTIRGNKAKVNPPTVYWNAEQEYEATCPGGTTGTPVTVVVLAHTYSSLISISDANTTALAAARNEAQGQLSCTPTPTTYTNTEQSYTANCPSGYTGTPQTVTKLAGTYTSTISIADANANALAAATAEANAALVCNQIVYWNLAQSYTATCPSGYSGTPVTVTKDSATYSSIISVDAANALAYNAAQAQAQAAIVCTVIPTVYWNTPQGYTATCQSGYTGNPVTVVIPANTYSSTSSVIAANTIALNAATTQANAQLVCTYVASCTTSAPGAPSNAFRFWLNDHNRSTVNMSSYGISGSSVSGLSQLNSDLRGSGKPAYTIVAPNSLTSIAGTDANGYASWMTQIYDFKLTGTPGATAFETTSNIENPIGITTPFFPRPQYSTGNGGGQGYLFNDVSVGSNTITLSSSGDAANFSVGAPVLLAGQETQFAGMPPNPQFFQWVTITNIAGAVLTLDQPLKNSWIGANWWESTNFAGEDFSFGKPRAFPLWKGSPSNFRYTRHAVIQNLELRPNTQSGTAGITNSADSSIFYNVRFAEGGSPWHTQTRIAAYIKCRMWDTEPDKIVDSLFMESDTIISGVSSDNGFTGATGVWYLDVRNCIFGYTGLSPAIGYWEGNTSTRSNTGFGWYYQPAGKPTHLYMFKNNTFISPGNNEGATNMGYVSQLEVDGTNVQITGTTKFSIVDDSQDGSPHPYRDQVVTLRIGAPIWTDGGKMAFVTNVEYISDRFIISTDATGANVPQNGDTWNYSRCWQMKDYGCNTHSVYGIPFFSPLDRRWNGDTTTSLSVQHLSVFNENSVKKTHTLDGFNLFGKIDSFTINITTPYTGGSATAFLQVKKDGVELYRINVKTIGTRTYGVSGTSGFVTGDVAFSDAPLDSWGNTMSINLVDNAGNMLGVNSSTEPKFTTRMKWWPYKKTL
jgi:hypothetical protein